MAAALGELLAGQALPRALRRRRRWPAPLLVGGVAQQACSLMLRLSEVQTLDGVFGCTARETPRLVARVALD